MNPDQYQQAWKAESAQMQVTFDAETLSNEVRQSHKSFQSTIFWRDVREAGTSLTLIPIWFLMGYWITLPWTWYLMVPALIWVAGFILVDRKRHPQRPSAPGEPLLFYVKESLTQVEHQIWLLRNVFWWYLMPAAVAMMAFFLHVSWNTSSTWWGFACATVFWSLFVVAVDGGVYYLNQFAVRHHLEPRRQALLKLVTSLESETIDEDSEDIVKSGDIMELVTNLAGPVYNAGLSPGWERWADNWNQIIPSWRVVAAIAMPTLIGAACGFWYPIPDMGPTFFQAIVGAVIAFEVALGWFLWHFVRKRRKLATGEHQSADQESPVPAGRERSDLTSPDVPHPSGEMRLPRAPAIVIILLILLLSALAIGALVSFRHLIGGRGSSENFYFLSEPNFDDISEFNDSDVADIDAWIQEQCELGKYPSLTVAIVRDGEIAYKQALGFEDIESGKQATLQTQYHVASVTKAFTASLAVMLHEQGVVDIDQPVVKYLPQSVSISTTPNVGATITLRQLASHTSGLPRGVPGRVQSVDGWYELEPQRLYDHLANVKLESDPGTVEEYSNLGFGLLGHALELAAQKPYDQLIKDMICDPLQLKQTAIQSDGSLDIATGYDASESRHKKTHSFEQRLAPSGGLVTSVEDLTKFLSAQMEPGVFTTEMLDRLQRRTMLSNSPPGKSATGTSLGWSLGFSRYLSVFLMKNGGRSNCSAWIGYSPEHGVGVAVATNCGGPDVDRIGRWLLERSAPGLYTPTQNGIYAMIAPFTGVRWENDRPIVQVNDVWSPIVSIDDIPVDQIMKFAKEEYGAKARKRFTEDLVEVLATMGHKPDWEVTLGLQLPSGKIEQQKIRMTKDKRELAREFARTNN